MAGLTPGQCPGAGQVHAIQPVGALARQRGFIERLPALIVVQLVEGTADGGAVHVADQQAFDRPAPAHVLQHFLHQQLAFAIGVAGMHDLIGQLELLADGLELTARLAARLELPLLGDDRQVIQRPALEALVVVIRRGLLQQVADAPGDTGVTGIDIAVALA